MSPVASQPDRSRPLEGAEHASLMLVGEQPGDTEDLQGSVTLTAHPSSILRSRTDRERGEAVGQFIADLKGVAQWLSAR